jgi:hypothetical protein
VLTRAVSNLLAMRRPRRRGLLAALTAAALLATIPGLASARPAAHDPGRPAGDLVDADDFTGSAGPLAEGQLELAVLSTRAATVTGGDALVGVRGVTDADRVTITRNGEDVTAAFHPEPDDLNPGRTMLVGLVDGLVDGDNEIRLQAVRPGTGARFATLPVRNHPSTGPVLSGPHQELFVCRVDELRDYAPASGEGPDARPRVLDDDCSIEPYVRWYYLSTRPPDGLPFDPASPSAPSEVPYDTWDWVELTDPYGEYPSDVATTVTTEGKVVPAIARVETRTINRGITRVAILDDPAARGPDAPFEVPDAWNGKVLYNWGASCGIGRQQGINTPNEVLSGGVDAGGSALDVGPEVFRPAVLQGYLVPHSTLTTFNTHCNQVLSAETMMMVREHLIEAYGRIDWVMGNGASGGAIQQYTTMNGYPGLQDGGLPLVSFPDVVTTAMSPADCRLLRQLFALSDGPVLAGQAQLQDGAGRELPVYGPRWTLEKRNAITGHDFQGICEDWDDMFADLLVADRGCSRIPAHLRYSRESKTGERCTLQDNLVHFLGVDPETGYARRPVDNVGVQYGYRALLDGVISVDEFLYLNRHVGSFDEEGYGPWDPGRDDTDVARDAVQPRMAMDPDLVHDLYRYGFVTGRGAIDQAPIIDVNLYADPVPILGFHDQARGYMAAERIERTFGSRETHSIWSGVLLTNDAWPTMHSWLDALVEARRATGGVSDDGSWTDEVAAARPAQGGDACVVTTAGYAPVPLAAPGVAGERGKPCEQVFRVGASPRIAAGGPTTEDVVKCRTTAPRRSLYPGITFTAEQWAELTEIFPDGVCDWTRPGVGEVARSQTWLHWGNDDVPFTGEPTVIPHVVARTR